MHSIRSFRCRREFRLPLLRIDGGMNAAILVSKDSCDLRCRKVLKKLKAYSEEMKETVQKKAEKLDEIGYQAYLEK